MFALPVQVDACEQDLNKYVGWYLRSTPASTLFLNCLRPYKIRTCTFAFCSVIDGQHVCIPVSSPNGSLTANFLDQLKSWIVRCVMKANWETVASTKCSNSANQVLHIIPVCKQCLQVDLQLQFKALANIFRTFWGMKLLYLSQYISRHCCSPHKLLMIPLSRQIQSMSTHKCNKVLWKDEPENHFQRSYSQWNLSDTLQLLKREQLCPFSAASSPG